MGVNDDYKVNYFFTYSIQPVGRAKTLSSNYTFTAGRENFTKKAPHSKELSNVSIMPDSCSAQDDQVLTYYLDNTKYTAKTKEIYLKKSAFDGLEISSDPEQVQYREHSARIKKDNSDSNKIYINTDLNGAWSKTVSTTNNPREVTITGTIPVGAKASITLPKTYENWKETTREKTYSGGKNVVIYGGEKFSNYGYTVIFKYRSFNTAFSPISSSTIYSKTHRGIITSTFPTEHSEPDGSHPVTVYGHKFLGWVNESNIWYQKRMSMTQPDTYPDILTSDSELPKYPIFHSGGSTDTETSNITYVAIWQAQNYKYCFQSGNKIFKKTTTTGLYEVTLPSKDELERDCPGFDYTTAKFEPTTYPYDTSDGDTETRNYSVWSEWVGKEYDLGKTITNCRGWINFEVTGAKPYDYNITYKLENQHNKSFDFSKTNANITKKDAVHSSYSGDNVYTLYNPNSDGRLIPYTIDDGSYTIVGYRVERPGYSTLVYSTDSVIKTCEDLLSDYRGDIIVIVEVEPADCVIHFRDLYKSESKEDVKDVIKFDLKFDEDLSDYNYTPKSGNKKYFYTEEQAPKRPKYNLRGFSYKLDSEDENNGTNDILIESGSLCSSGCFTNDDDIYGNNFDGIKPLDLILYASWKERKSFRVYDGEYWREVAKKSSGNNPIQIYDGSKWRPVLNLKIKPFQSIWTNIYSDTYKDK